MHHRVTARDDGVDRRGIGDVAEDHVGLAVEPAQTARRRGDIKQGYLITARKRTFGQKTAKETGAAGNDDFHDVPPKESRIIIGLNITSVRNYS